MAAERIRLAKDAVHATENALTNGRATPAAGGSRERRTWAWRRSQKQKAALDILVASRDRPWAGGRIRASEAVTGIGEMSGLQPGTSAVSPDAHGESAARRDPARIRPKAPRTARYETVQPAEVVQRKPQRLLRRTPRHWWPHTNRSTLGRRRFCRASNSRVMTANHARRWRRSRGGVPSTTPSSMSSLWANS